MSTVATTTDTVYQQLRQMAGEKSGRGLRRVTMKLSEGPELLAWLAAQSGPQAYFADRSGDRAFAATGALLVENCEAPDKQFFHRLEQWLEDADDDIAFYGGMRFDAGPRKTPDPVWQDFSGAYFFIPRFETIRFRDHWEVAMNWLDDDEPGPSPEPAELLPALSRQAISRRVDTPNEEKWNDRVETILRALQQDAISKVVLARRTTWEPSGLPSPHVLAARLFEDAPNCFHFLLRPGQGKSAFFGASPELLYARYGRELLSEAVAGTRRRGASSEEDRRLARELWESEKEQQEHRFVANMIGGVLGSLCQTMRREEPPSVLKLARVQHLRTPFTGELLPSVDDADLLGALHPTPATGGTPREEALAWIRRMEEFDRGFYAAPLGRISRTESIFTVAIRSGLAAGDALHVFAGAGIVPGSDPTREWDELEKKIGDFLKLGYS